MIAIQEQAFNLQICLQVNFQCYTYAISYHYYLWPCIFAENYYLEKDSCNECQIVKIILIFEQNIFTFRRLIEIKLIL